MSVKICIIFALAQMAAMNMAKRFADLFFQFCIVPLHKPLLHDYHGFGQILGPLDDGIGQNVAVNSADFRLNILAGWGY
jgi:hypothetical protein